MIELINTISAYWMTFFSLAAAQNSIFLGIVFLLIYLLRNRNAKMQYGIGLAGLIKLILPPFIPLQLEKSLNPVLTAPLKSISAAVEMNSIQAKTGVSAALSWTGLGFIIWLTGALVFLFAVSYSFVKLLGLLKNGKPVEKTKIGRRKIGVVLQDNIDIPMSFGLLPKNIFVPPSWLKWPPGLQKMVLDHELAHIKRYDGIVQLLQTIVLALYWFNPLVWLLVWRLNTLREMVCDDISVSVNKTAPVLYSRYLVKIAEEMVRSKVSIYSFSALIRKKSSLQKRVEYQMKEKKMKSISKQKIVFIFAVIFSAALALSWNLSEADSISAAEDDEDKIEIVIIDEQNVKVNGKKAAIDNLKSVLDKITADKDIENIKVFLKPRAGTKMGTVNRVHDDLRKSKLLRIHYTKDDPNYGSNFVLPPKNNPEMLKKISKKNILEIYINSSGGVTSGDDQYSNLQLVQLVKTRLKHNPNLIVSVQIDKRCKYDDYRYVIESLKKADAKRISIGYN